MASDYFVCRNCHCRLRRNPRLKQGQHYCGSRSCQQQRKNDWELKKLRSDEFYREKRLAAKKQHYRSRSGDRYQDFYRQNHPEYVEANRKSQRIRNSKRSINASASKIVKTDALTPVSSVSSGFYVLLPCRNLDMEKIVKTDALIVELRISSELEKIHPVGGP